MEPVEKARARRGPEFIVALIVFALPLAYLLTERTSEVFFWRYSKPWLAGIAGYEICFAALLFSYSRALPKWVALLRKLLVALATSLLVVLLACEAILHASDRAAFEALDNVGRHKFDADVGHVYLPNYSQVIQSREFSTQWHSNAEGLRADHDFGPKAAGVVRVLVVGDSFTVGDQVRFEETYPSVMQSEFDRILGPGRVEVLNAGFPGFGTIHERKWIQKFACAFEPDLVVVGSTPNDLLENKFPILYEARNGALVDHRATEGDRLKYEERRRWYSLPGWVSRSLVMQKLDALNLQDRLAGKSGSVHARAFQIDAERKSRANEQSPRELYAVYEREIVLARDAAARCHAKFAVLAIPFLEQLRKAPPGQDFSLWGKRLAEIGARAGFPVVDLLPDFQAAGDPHALYWREDSHCNAAGYRLIGVGASSSLAKLGAELGLVRAR
jgi:lysophospholipase L1-like esterase